MVASSLLRKPVYSFHLVSDLPVLNVYGLVVEESFMAQ
jgi:hypothetical protein